MLINIIYPPSLFNTLYWCVLMTGNGQLAGKVALITGAASGIGRATAILFAKEGAAISIIDIKEKEGQEVVKTIKENGGQAIFIKCDVTKTDECIQAVQQTVNELGGINILFNNVGVLHRTSVLETTEEEWDLVNDINLKSAFLFSKYSIPHMIKAGGGSIICSGSGWSFRGGNKAVTYCVTKSAIVNFIRCLAIEHGPDNIRANCICPGDTDTYLIAHESEQMGIDHEQYKKESAARRPLRRIGQPEDIAKAVLYLVSDQSSYMTGAFLVVDGGGMA